MLHRVLAIDVGIWNFSYAVACRRSYSIAFLLEQWENVSLPAVAGYTMAHGRISVTDISLTMLTDMCFTAMHRLFPEYYIRHNIQSVYIESQPKYPGCSNKIAELSNERSHNIDLTKSSISLQTMKIIVEYMQMHKGVEPAVIPKPLKSNKMAEVTNKADADFIDAIGQNK